MKTERFDSSMPVYSEYVVWCPRCKTPLQVGMNVAVVECQNPECKHRIAVTTPTYQRGPR